MKPFDLEAAKRGDPIVTREGKPVMATTLHFRLIKEHANRVETPDEAEMTVVDRYYMYKPHCRFIKLIQDNSVVMEHSDTQRATIWRKR